MAKHSLTGLVRRTWKALVISWFVKASLLRMLATITPQIKDPKQLSDVGDVHSLAYPSSFPSYRYLRTARKGPG